jgi:hypothetical protein
MWRIAFCGFCVKEVGEPNRVGNSVTIWPVEVSWYFKYPEVPCALLESRYGGGFEYVPL